jgi:hypothetical protein
LSNPLLNEGIVACDDAFERFKFKSRAYELLYSKLDKFELWHYTYDKFIYITFCLPENTEESLSQFRAIYTEWSPWLESVWRAVRRCCDEVDGIVDDNKLLEIPTADFVNIASEHTPEWSRILFPLVKRGFKKAWTYFAAPDSMKMQPLNIHFRWLLQGGIWKPKKKSTKNP